MLYVPVCSFVCPTGAVFHLPLRYSRKVKRVKEWSGLVIFYFSSNAIHLQHDTIEATHKFAINTTWRCTYYHSSFQITKRTTRNIIHLKLLAHGTKVVENPNHNQYKSQKWEALRSCDNAWFGDVYTNLVLSQHIAKSLMVWYCPMLVYWILEATWLKQASQASWSKQVPTEALAAWMMALPRIWRGEWSN